MEKGKLFIISAPTGVGKTTLVSRALKQLKDEISIDRVVTYTLRTSRKGETDGVDYHFISPESFQEKSVDGFFLETNVYHARSYGSPASIIDDLEEGKNLILIVDREGAKSAVAAVRDAVTIWISAPSLEVIKQRLIGRGTESGKKIEQRLEIAKQEIEYEEKHPMYRYHIVNDIFETAVGELVHIIMSEAA